jgi:hypothetical protein
LVEKVGLSTSKETRQVSLKIRSMLVKFSNSKGIVHQEFVPTCQTINQCYYSPDGPEVSEHWWDQDWLIHRDSLLAHVALSLQPFLAAKKRLSSQHHSPDLAPCDFFLFPRMKLQV